MEGQKLLLFIQNDLALRKTVIVATCRPAKPISRYIIRRCEIGTWGTNPRAQVFQWLIGNGSLGYLKEPQDMDGGEASI
jgi:hypothetical protein